MYLLAQRVVESLRIKFKRGSMLASISIRNLFRDQTRPVIPEIRRHLTGLTARDMTDC